MMRNPLSLGARSVTLVTLLAMLALGATSAFGLGTCMHSVESAVEQPQHDHGAPPQAPDGSDPCTHALQGGVCTPVTLPGTTAIFSAGLATVYVAPFIDVLLPNSLRAAAVFHPPRS